MKPMNRTVVVFLSLILAVLLGAKANLTIKIPGNSESLKICRAAWVGVWQRAVSGDGSTIASAKVQYVDSLSQTVSNRNGSIVLREADWSTLTLVDELMQFQRSNASAVVLSTFYGEPGRALYTIKERWGKLQSVKSQLKIPVFETTDDDCGETFDRVKNSGIDLSNPNISYFGLLDTTDIDNGWFQLIQSQWMVAIRIAFFLPPLAGASIVLYRLFPMLLFKGLKPSLPIGILFLEFLSHSLRFVIAIDPLGMVGNFDPFNVLFWSSTNVAIATMCHIIILFYWNYSMNLFWSKSIVGLLRYTYIFFGVILAAEVIYATISALGIASELLIFCRFFYLLTLLGIVSYIFYTFFQLNRFLATSKLNAKQSRARAKIVLSSQMMLVNGCLLFVLAVLNVLFLTPIVRTSLAEPLFFLAQFIVISTIGIIETLVIRPVKKHDRIPTTYASSSNSMSSRSSSGSSSPTTARRSHSQALSSESDIVELAKVTVPNDYIVSSGSDSATAAGSSISASFPLSEEHNESSTNSSLTTKDEKSL